MSPLLKVAKIAITHLSLGHKTPPKNFQGRENSLGQLIYKKSVVVLEKTHARTQRHHYIISLPGFTGDNYFKNS